MEFLETYQKNTMEIDEIKEEKLRNGLTNECKKVIDEAYLKMSGKEEELEVKLYERKSDLLNRIKTETDLNYDMLMSCVGAILGVVIGHCVQKVSQLVAEMCKNMTKETFGTLSPLDIIYGDSHIDETMIFLFLMIIIMFAVYKKPI